MLPSRAQRRPKALHVLLAAVLIGSTAALAALVWWPPALPEQAGSAQVGQPCPAAEAPEPAAPVAPPPPAAPPSSPPSSDAAPHALPAPAADGELAGCKRGE